MDALWRNPSRSIFAVASPPIVGSSQGKTQEIVMAKKGGGIFHQPAKGVQPPSKGGSAPQNTSVGSGCRPTRSKYEIETSAPMDPQGLGRKTKGALS